MPDLLQPISVIPHTLSGKRIEVPVKRILQGTPVDDAVARGALTDTSGLAEFEAFRDTLSSP